MAESRKVMSAQALKRKYFEDKLSGSNVSNLPKSSNINVDSLSTHKKVSYVSLPKKPSTPSNISKIAAIINDDEIFNCSDSKSSPKYDNSYKGFDSKGYESKDRGWDDDSKYGDDDDDMIENVNGIKKRSIKILNQPIERNPLNVKYELVEKRMIGGVTMAQQVVSKKRTQDRVNEKPELLKILAAKSTVKPQPLYGPQLPVAWVAEADGRGREGSSTRRKHQQKKKSQGVHHITTTEDGSVYEETECWSEDSADSVTAEVEDWLASRRGVASHEDIPVSHTADSYMRSSYSGSLLKKAAPVKMQQIENEVPRNNHVADVLIAKHHIPNTEFIGPQLPIDWGARSLANTQHSLRMDITRGRDIKRVLRKGEEIHIKFGDANYDMLDKYAAEGETDGADTEALPAGNTVDVFGKAKIVPNFDKQISRRDVIGPFGEKPERSKLPTQEENKYLSEYLNQEGIDIRELYSNGNGNQNILDLNAEHALDKLNRRGHIEPNALYDKDRYPEIESEPIDENIPIPEDYYKGMADAIMLKKNLLIDFNHMRGRAEEPMDANDKKLREAELAKLLRDANEFGLEVDTGGVLDLQEGVNKALEMKFNPKNNLLLFPNLETRPRFEVSKEDQAAIDREIKSAALRREDTDVFGGKPSQLLDMNKQIGRNDGKASEDMQTEVHGVENSELAIALAEERERKLVAGHQFQSHIKTPNYLVRFDKQLVHAEVPEDAKIQAQYGEDKVQYYDEGPTKAAVNTMLAKVTDWNKQLDRGNINIKEMKGEDLHLLQQEEEGKVLELTVDPKSQSKWKKEGNVPNFSQQYHGEKDKYDLTGLMQEDGLMKHQDKVLILEEVDPRKFKENGNPSHKLLNMDMHAPRKAAEVNPNANILGELKEELILAPDHEKSSRHQRLIAHKWSDNAPTPAVKELEMELEELILSPKKEYIMRTGADWSKSNAVDDKNQSVKQSIRDLGISHVLDDAGDVLKLSPRTYGDENSKPKQTVKWSAEAPEPPTVSDLLNKINKSGKTSSSSLLPKGEDKELLQRMQGEELILDNTSNIPPPAAVNKTSRTGFGTSKRQDVIPANTVNSLGKADKSGKSSAASIKLDKNNQVKEPVQRMEGKETVLQAYNKLSKTSNDTANTQDGAHGNISVSEKTTKDPKDRSKSSSKTSKSKDVAKEKKK